ncbi:MAG: late competence development ComFB family protein [Spirochaetes bacterium]|nr:late competence development ComFB family protein [Spirochaetota bacterium]MBU1079957.1 late competence development ComFB family protein [Spirochaetota bacterium]
MEIHNLMEDLVVKTVDELFDADVKGSSVEWCTCRQCRMDVACFVLNRLKPEYVLSGRGVAYSETDYGEKLQRGADVVTLVKEGWAKINAAPRPNHDHRPADEPSFASSGPVFNVRPIMGRLFNGETFEPIVDAAVSLSDESGLVKMMDSNWTNPYPLAKNTSGMFTFWPFPVPSAELGEKRLFAFTISAEPAGFDRLSHYLEFELVSEAAPILQFSTQAAHRLQDLYVFAK